MEIYNENLVYDRILKDLFGIKHKKAHILLNDIFVHSSVEEDVAMIAKSFDSKSKNAIKLNDLTKTKIIVLDPIDKMIED